MRLNIAEILKRIASSVNQEATAPTTNGSEYNLWMSYINRSIHEWSESFDWEDLRKDYFPPITSSSMATVALPLDFKKFAAPVTIHGTSESSDYTIPDILIEQKGMYGQNDKYITVRGDISSGRNMIFHPTSTLASGASVEVSYFSMPTLMTATTDIPPVSDSQFLIDRVTAYIFESRSDARFQEMEAKARTRLTMMIENSAAAKYNSYNNPNPVISTLRKQGFRTGRD